MKRGFVLIIALIAGIFNVSAQHEHKTLNDYIQCRTIDNEGKEIVGIMVPGRPPATHREPVAHPGRSSVSLTSVPAYDWSFGCSATSAAMAAGYYDNHNYFNMYTGPTNGGVAPMDNSVWGTVVISGETRAQCPFSATRLGLDGRTDTGHVDDYWVMYYSSSPDPYITNGWPEHTQEGCTGDFMGTNQSEVNNVDGSTVFFYYPDGSPLYNYTGHEPNYIDGCHGMRDFYESRGYTVVQNYNQYIYGWEGNTLGFTFNQYKQEIDAGRPVLIQIEGHTMLGYGYDDAGNTVYLHDTWDYNSHSMTWGGSYSGMDHYGVCVVELTPVIIYPVANFTAASTTTQPDSVVAFTDISQGSPTSWLWAFSPNTVTYHYSTTSASQNPRVSFDTSGFYTVSLTATNANGSDTEIKTNYIHVFIPGLWTGATSSDWNTASNWDSGTVPSSSTLVIIPNDAPHWPQFTGDFILGSQCDRLTFDSTTLMDISGNFTIYSGKTLDMTAGGMLSITGNWLNNGIFIPGNGTVRFNGNTSQALLAPSPDITAYSRTTFDKGMTALSGAGTGPTGDYGQGDYPIGFTFKYVGTEYTTIRISTNGWLSLNLTGNNGYNNAVLFTTSAPNASISAWWDDLADDGTSKVYYKTEGTAPNRVFTVEWNRVLTYWNATSRFSFQVKLFETTNAIEFHYGNLESGSHSALESASIGLEDPIGGSGHYLEATTGSSTTPVTNLVSTTDWPSVNYRFLPPALSQEFNHLVINNPGNVMNLNVNVIVNGNLTVMPGAALSVPTGKTITLNGVVAK